MLEFTVNFQRQVNLYGTAYEVLKACAGGGVAPRQYFLQGKGYYGDASKARNEVIFCDGWREK